MKDYETNNCIAFFTITALFLLLLGTFRSALAFWWGDKAFVSLCCRMWSSKVHQQAFFVLLRTMADHRYAAVCLESARISQLTNPKAGYLRHAAAYDPLSTLLCICHYAYGVHSIAFFTCSRSVSMTTIFFSFRQSSFLPRFMHLSLFFLSVYVYSLLWL